MAINELQILFRHYQDQYETLKTAADRLKDITELWSKTDSVDFLLYEFELIGSKLGKQVKKAPVKMEDVIYYRYSDGKLRYSASYAIGYAAFEIFFLYEKNKHISMTFGSDGINITLRKISVVHLQNDKQVKNEMYSVVNGLENYVESSIEYEKDNISIRERGFTHMGQNKIEINKDFQVEDKNGELLITLTVNNLAEGGKKKYQVFPKLKKG